MAYIHYFKAGGGFWDVLDVDVLNNSIQNDSLYVSDWFGSFDILGNDDISFYRLGNYYALSFCGRGSGYASSSLCLFKDLNSIPKNEIYANIYSAGMLNYPYQVLSSEIEANGDIITLNYEYKEGNNLEINDSIMQKQTKHLKFIIDYTLKDGYWKANDSTILKAINLPY